MAYINELTQRRAKSISVALAHEEAARFYSGGEVIRWMLMKPPRLCLININKRMGTDGTNMAHIRNIYRTYMWNIHGTYTSETQIAYINENGTYMKHKWHI
jgi:hypothetical protein